MTDVNRRWIGLELVIDVIGGFLVTVDTNTARQSNGMFRAYGMDESSIGTHYGYATIEKAREAIKVHQQIERKAQRASRDPVPVLYIAGRGGDIIETEATGIHLGSGNIILTGGKQATTGAVYLNHPKIRQWLAEEQASKKAFRLAETRLGKVRLDGLASYVTNPISVAERELAMAEHAKDWADNGDALAAEIEGESQTKQRS